MTPLEHAGARYVVSARGETEWVKNVRAAGGKAALGGTDVSLTEVAVGDRGAILARYQKEVGRPVAGHFKALPDAADHPVFKVG